MPRRYPVGLLTGAAYGSYAIGTKDTTRYRRPARIVDRLGRVRPERPTAFRRRRWIGSTVSRSVAIPEWFSSKPRPRTRGRRSDASFATSRVRTHARRSGDDRTGGGSRYLDPNDCARANGTRRRRRDDGLLSPADVHARDRPDADRRRRSARRRIAADGRGAPVLVVRNGRARRPEPGAAPRATLSTGSRGARRADAAPVQRSVDATVHANERGRSRTRGRSGTTSSRGS